jgi:hypothetical protein
MAAGLTEDALVEQPALRLLADLSWEVASGFDESSDRLARSGVTRGPRWCSCTGCVTRSGRVAHQRFAGRAEHHADEAAAAA